MKSSRSSNARSSSSSSTLTTTGTFRSSGASLSAILRPSLSLPWPDTLFLCEWVNSNFRLADVVTVMNGVCGLNALFSAARFLSSPTTQKSSLWWALAFPVLGFGFDVFDGKIARWMHSSSMLGQEMDSLADLVRLYPFFALWRVGKARG